MRGRIALLCACGLLCACSVAIAQEALPASPASWNLGTYIKASLLRSDTWNEPPAPQAETTGFARIRLEPTWRSSTLTASAAYEQWLEVGPATPVAFGSIAVVKPRAPYRIVQLDWTISDDRGTTWRQEIDRAFLAAHLSRAEITIGRQAVGWGRSVIFGVVDLFAPFSPLEPDREWRRGIDAIRADVRLARRVSLDSVAAFGESTNESAFAARLRGFAGDVDAEVIGGWRIGEPFAGVTASAALGAAEVHGEVAVFGTKPGTTPDRAVVKSIVGASRRLPIGSGVFAFIEYYYSGFGAADPALIGAALADPDFQRRYTRGDIQVLGRHTFGTLGTYEFSPAWKAQAEWLIDARDGSGVVAPTIEWVANDTMSVTATYYVPHGSAPAAGVPRSSFGSTPRSLFAQLRLYF